MLSMLITDLLHDLGQLYSILLHDILVGVMKLASFSFWLLGGLISVET